LTTLFGNIYTGLALLVPFTISFYIQFVNIKLIYKYFLILLKIGIFLFFIFLFFEEFSISEVQIKTLICFLLPTIFLITVLPFLSKKSIIVTFVSIILLLFISYLYRSRTMMIRVPLLLMFLITVGFYRFIYFKSILRYSFLILFIPLYLLYNSYESGKSFFEIDLGNVTSDKELSIDSRTFLYQEVYFDLFSNEQILVGKGANGAYYSEYFDITGEENKNRLTVEVGILALFLKGGLISVIMNLVLLFISIYLSFFESKNSYVVGVGFVILVHVILLFVENLVGFNVYNLLIWFFIGICLSKEIRAMNNIEIREIIKIKRR
jgi:hypothetical protein